ncbi:MAG: hypothetical protein HC924_17625, partial [Synechococcaceae cyanobacterium SM2_3_2]|nr:hypothetical protein [Synechococcaceae cyanobacterium SM2_3_2]
MVFTPRPATELTVAQTFNSLTDQILLVRSGQLFKLAALPVGPPGADGQDGAPGPSVELRTSDGFLQTRIEGSDTWTDLVSLAQISGATISASTGVPDNADGREGDLYINTNNGDLYQKGSSVWAVIGNITGPQGATGATGAQGPAGSGGGSFSGDQPDYSSNVSGIFVNVSSVQLPNYFSINIGPIRCIQIL